MTKDGYGGEAHDGAAREEMSGMILLRRLIGDVLRRHRIRQSRTLRDVSAAAQVSLGYLSEVERGRKEPSSELLAAICAALDVSLADVLREVSADLATVELAAVRRPASVHALTPALSVTASVPTTSTVAPANAVCIAADAPVAFAGAPRSCAHVVAA